MKVSFINNISIAIVSMALTVWGCGKSHDSTSGVEELPYYNEANFTPVWMTSGTVPNDFHQIPSFSLINQKGNEFTEKNLDNKLTVVDFFFTSCPGICPKMTDNMMMVQEAFLTNDLVQIISHSVTPEYDSVEVLQEYASLKGINDEKWHLLTGDRKIIYDLGRNHYFIEEDLGLLKDLNDFIHTENFVLIDHHRRIRGIYNGLNKTSIRQLIADTEMLQKSI
jgi:protein SCO1/2